MSERSSTRAGSEKFLTFCLGREEFAVSVEKIREIIPLQEITAVPQAPQFVLGVINLRGKVVPVVDLRSRLGMPPAETAGRACIVVMQPKLSRGLEQIGVVVDGVSEVLQIAAGEVEETSAFGQGLIESSYVKGIANNKGRVKILLDIDRVLVTGETASLAC